MSGSTDSTEMLKIWDTSSVGKDILKVLLGLGNSEALDGISSLVGVFIMNSEVFGRSSGNFVDGRIS